MSKKIVIEIPKELEELFYTCIATECNYPSVIIVDGQGVKNPQTEEEFAKEQILGGIQRCYADGKAKLKIREISLGERAKALKEIKDLKVTLEEK